MRSRFNIAPTQPIVALLNDPARSVEEVRWGLVPPHAEHPSAVKLSTFNARIETIAKAPTYRDAFHTRRCAIFADGFYEWRADNDGGKTPLWIHRTDDEPFVFAGVWERATLLEYGGWDERWPRNSDSEMAARFLARGERLICLPAMGAAYVPRDSLKGLWSQYLGYGEYRARTYRAHPRSMRASHLLAPAVVVTAAAAVAGPGPVGRLGRLGLGVYGLALATAGARARPAAESASDAALVPVTLATMHFAHGIGQLSGWVRYGPPVAALTALAGRGDAGEPADALTPPYAPSLSAAAGAAP